MLVVSGSAFYAGAVQGRRHEGWTARRRSPVDRSEDADESDELDELDSSLSFTAIPISPKPARPLQTSPLPPM